MQKEIQVIHEKAIKIAENYVRAESDLIEILQILDDRKAYRELGYRSLFDYGTQALKLSENVTYNLITVARKSKEIPELQSKIRNREISLSNARMIAPVLTPQNQDVWLNAAASLPKRTLEKKLAAENPKLAVRENVRPISKERLELKVGISEELHQALLQAQALLSSKTRQAATLEATLQAMTELFLEAKDPVRKARRALAKKSEPTQVEPIEPNPQKPGVERRKNVRVIPAAVKNRVHLRDQGQCTQYDLKGLRCKEKQWLDMHHLIPVSKGGASTLENLATVCKAHHKMIHSDFLPGTSQLMIRT